MSSAYMSPTKMDFDLRMSELLPTSGLGNPGGPQRDSNSGRNNEIRNLGIVGKSAALQQVLQHVETVAPSDATVLIFGETGTGKELVALAIHELSRRKDKPLVR